MEQNPAESTISQKELGRKSGLSSCAAREKGLKTSAQPDIFPDFMKMCILDFYPVLPTIHSQIFPSKKLPGISEISNKG